MMPLTVDTQIYFWIKREREREKKRERVSIMSPIPKSNFIESEEKNNILLWLKGLFRESTIFTFRW